MLCLKLFTVVEYCQARCVVGVKFDIYYNVGTCTRDANIGESCCIYKHVK